MLLVEPKSIDTSSTIPSTRSPSSPKRLSRLSGRSPASFDDLMRQGQNVLENDCRSSSLVSVSTVHRLSSVAPSFGKRDSYCHRQGMAHPHAADSHADLLFYDRHCVRPVHFNGRASVHHDHDRYRSLPVFSTGAEHFMLGYLEQ